MKFRKKCAQSSALSPSYIKFSSGGFILSHHVFSISVVVVSYIVLCLLYCVHMLCWLWTCILRSS